MSAQEITDGAFKAYSPDCSKDTNELLFRIITSNDDDDDGDKKKIIPYIYTSPFSCFKMGEERKGKAEGLNMWKVEKKKWWCEEKGSPISYTIQRRCNDESNFIWHAKKSYNPAPDPKWKSSWLLACSNALIYVHLTVVPKKKRYIFSCSKWKLLRLTSQLVKT